MGRISPTGSESPIPGKAGIFDLPPREGDGRSTKGNVAASVGKARRLLTPLILGTPYETSSRDLAQKRNAAASPL
jgi:hypothetical protein